MTFAPHRALWLPIAVVVAVVGTTTLGTPHAGAAHPLPTASTPTTAKLRLPFVAPRELASDCGFGACWRARRKVRLHARRSRESRVVATLLKGRKVRFVRALFVVRRPEVVTLRQPLLVRFRRSAPGPESKVRLRPGDRLDVLHPTGEDMCLVWVGGRLADADGCGAFSPKKACRASCAGIIVKRGKIDSWFKLRTRRGRVGWTQNIGGFIGQDACQGRQPKCAWN